MTGTFQSEEGGFLPPEAQVPAGPGEGPGDNVGATCRPRVLWVVDGSKALDVSMEGAVAEGHE